MKCYHSKNSPYGALFLFKPQEKYTVFIFRNVSPTMLTLIAMQIFYLIRFHGG